MSSEHGQQCYWLMALGERGKFWDPCRKGRIACIGWRYVGSLRNYKNQEELEKIPVPDKKDKCLGGPSALACWEFCHVMKPGDTIFVKGGMTCLLGYGTVQSGYCYNPNRKGWHYYYPHVRTVEWSPEMTVPWDRVRFGRALIRKALTNITRNKEFVANIRCALGIEP